ncbi:DUF305 domain-containing protein [Mycolicibacterium austroafricanum]|uniref:DUF305 domain-containing protein n=1 Tax=Mycolicibacterium austroafricanum TaxID=39687 RepID=UPI001CA33F91|nr:DUF305 domain-containing protein [Mycolicibacterium austroafricanum]QZT61539.1 DUF305 domain-containing protein [Mycolicibacterium austroafricanum]
MSSKRGLLMGAGAVGAAFALLLSGCSDVGTQSADHDHITHQHEATPDGGAHTGGAHTDADIAFARDMVPHHEQAIVMSDIILAKRGIDPRVTELANQIKAAQGPEIATMQQWLTEWGAPAASGHDGHDMGDPSAHAAMGMMTEEQLEQLRLAEGVEAARLFLTGMIAHHEGAVTMAQTEVDSGKAQDAVHLAHEIIDTQQREIVVMKQILGSL